MPKFMIKHSLLYIASAVLSHKVSVDLLYNTVKNIGGNFYHF